MAIVVETAAAGDAFRLLSSRLERRGPSWTALRSPPDFVPNLVPESEILTRIDPDLPSEARIT
jgi:hypothetical protein